MTDFTSKLRHIRETLRLSRRALSDLLDVPEGKIQKIEIGDQRADHEFLSHLGKIVGADINWLLDNDGEIVDGYFPATFHDHAELTAKAAGSIMPVPTSDAPTPSEFVPIQRFDVDASAGDGALAETEIGTGHYAFNRSWLDRRGLKPDNLAVIAVRGDSMEPELYDKDLILLDQTQKEPRDGDMYVVRYSDELFVKRVQKKLNKEFELRSTNRFYGPIVIVPDTSTDLEFIGKVVASMHEW